MADNATSAPSRVGDFDYRTAGSLRRLLEEMAPKGARFTTIGNKDAGYRIDCEFQDRKLHLETAAQVATLARRYIAALRRLAREAGES